jgi:hypothetical protein
LKEGWKKISILFFCPQAPKGGVKAVGFQAPFRGFGGWFEKANDELIFSELIHLINI